MFFHIGLMLPPPPLSPFPHLIPVYFLLPYLSHSPFFLSFVPSFLSRAASPPSDQTYVQAAAIFQQLRPEKTVAPQLLHYRSKTDEPLAESRDRATQRQACHLAFNTLKCMKFNRVVFSNCGNFCIISGNSLERMD